MAVHQTRAYFQAKYGRIVDEPHVGRELADVYWVGGWVGGGMRGGGGGAWTGWVGGWGGKRGLGGWAGRRIPGARVARLLLPVASAGPHSPPPPCARPPAMALPTWGLWSS